MRESKIEKALITGVVDHGGECLKITSPNRKGVFDRLVIMPGNYYCWVELKTEEGILSRQQQAFQSCMWGLGCRAVVLYGLHDVQTFLTTLPR